MSITFDWRRPLVAPKPVYRWDYATRLWKRRAYVPRSMGPDCLFPADW
jgi:hypothetical protein